MSNTKTNAYLDIANALFSQERCASRLRGIWENDRWFTNSAFQCTAAFCERQMLAMQLDDVVRFPLKADGKTQYGEWRIPKAWEVRTAKLRLGNSSGETLADYSLQPCCLAMNSAPTPRDGLTAKLVACNDEQLDETMRGKFVLTQLPAARLVQQALEHGIMGIISDYFPLYKGVREARAQMNGVYRWDNDFIMPCNDTGLFAFSIPPETGDRLRTMLASNEEVQLYALVDCEQFEGTLPTVSAVIHSDSSAKGEILLYGHLYEPGANDNASGCAALLEAVNIYKDAMKAGLLPTPARSIRIALGFECAGSTGFLLTHPELDERMCIVADMVGTAAIDHARLGLWHNPLSNLSFLDALAEDTLIRIGCSHETRPFSIGTDNMLSDPSFDMPTVAFITEPALSYHSSMDTPDRIETAVLHRNTSALFALVAFLANAAPEDIPFLSGVVDGFDLSSCLKKHQNVSKDLQTSLKQEMHAEIRDFCEGKRHAVQPSLSSWPTAPDEASLRIPKRTKKGCLTLARRDPSGRVWHTAWNTALHLPLFWADGKRSIWEIACLYCEETGSNDPNAAYAEIKAFFDVLALDQVIDWET